MSGHHPFETLRARMTPERRARNAARTQELLAAMPLQALRQARAHSQAELAQRLHVQQPAIAKLEQRTDMYVSTLRHFVEALGGTLDIVAHFPEGSVTITQFAALGPPATDEPAE